MDYQVVLSRPRALIGVTSSVTSPSTRRIAPFNSVGFLISRTRLLARSPELGRIVPEFGDAFIREIVVGSYRVVYRLDDSRHLIEVIRFWHAARGTPEINA